MTPLVRPAAILFLALFVVDTSSGTGSESALKPVAAANATSSPSSENNAAPATSISVTLDVLSNRHAISSYVYGGAYPQDAPTITDSGLTTVRWGGNATSTYNWKLFTNNADADWYFEDFAYTEIGDGDSAQYIKDVKAAGSSPLMTMAMLPWVAKTAEASGNGDWSFSAAKYGAQCSVDPYNPDAGDGLKSDCVTTLTANPNDAYWPLLDQPGTSDPQGSVYRNQWAAALAAAFGTAPHFYDMDNEIDIWGSTHRDIHPNPSAYDELRDTYLTEAQALKGWDVKAIRFGPVSCCWWYYWNGADGNDKTAHAGIDFLPWWLNQVYWQDQIAGSRSLDMFDIHAYPDSPDISQYLPAQKQALAVSIYRDYWDPTYVSPSGSINQPWATQTQPNKTIPFRIPRMRAIVNSIYPGTPLAMTEWSASFAGESDFSTALGDADAFGLLGRERVSLASRWTAAVSANPNYQALKLFTNYDGAHHGFGTTSVSAVHNGDPDLFSIYAALNPSGNTMTVLVLNKDPGNSAQVQIATNGFTATSYTTYTLSQSSPTSIVASGSKSWSSTQTFAAYTATLLVVSGTVTTPPASEWDLNPDTIMVPANGTVTLQPKITSGSTNITMSSAVFDSYDGSTVCSGGNLTLTTPTLTPSLPGEITVDAGSTPGFCHFTVTANVGSVTQNQSGWIVVGNPAATLSKTGGDGQTGTHGTKLPQSLQVTFAPGQSGGSANGASIFFSTNAGTLSNGTASGSKVIAVTDGSGVASVTLTLPSSAQVVTVTAEGPYGLGHPVVSFTETSQ